MSGNIRFPNINGSTDAAKLVQIQSYLHQLVQDLNYSLANMDTGSSRVVMTSRTGATTAEKKNEAASTFNSIKALIIKSADIVNAYYDVISKKLEGMYIAESDFGTYTENTALTIEANSKGIKQLYEDMQSIFDDLERELKQIKVNARINTGILYYDENGAPVYGLEIGQKTEIDGVEVFNKFAQFKSDELAFFDQNAIKVAYISDTKLYIENVEVKVTYKMGGFEDKVLEPGGSIVTKWVGYGGDG